MLTWKCSWLASWDQGFTSFTVMFRTSALPAKDIRVSSILLFLVKFLRNTNTLPVINFLTVATCCTFSREILIWCSMLFIISFTRLFSTGPPLSFSVSRCTPFPWPSSTLFLYLKCIFDNFFCLLECSCPSGFSSTNWMYSLTSASCSFVFLKTASSMSLLSPSSGSLMHCFLT